MGHEKKPKAKLRRDDLRTFRRLLGFARPYAWRILVGGAASVVGGGSLIALFLLAQNLLTFLIDNNPRPHAEEEAPAAEAPAVPGPATEIHAEVAEVESHAEFAETAELSESHAEVAEAAEPPDHPTIGPSDHPTRSPDAADST